MADLRQTDKDVAEDFKAIRDKQRRTLEFHWKNTMRTVQRETLEAAAARLEKSGYKGVAWDLRAMKEEV